MEEQRLQEREKLYVVLSQTGTALSRLLRVVTGAKYNHSSVSLDRNLDLLYGFGRRWAWNPVFGGFVQESPHFGTFKRFPKTRVAVLEIPITKEMRIEIEQRFARMYEKRKSWHYDFLGLLVAAFGVYWRREQYYYCSDFVRSVLTDQVGIPKERFETIVQPRHFLDLPEATLIYEGLLQGYIPPGGRVETTKTEK